MVFAGEPAAASEREKARFDRLRAGFPTRSTRGQQRRHLTAKTVKTANRKNAAANRVVALKVERTYEYIYIYIYVPRTFDEYIYIYIRTFDKRRRNISRPDMLLLLLDYDNVPTCRVMRRYLKSLKNSKEF